jgi:hypothetical protein
MGLKIKSPTKIQVETKLHRHKQGKGLGHNLCLITASLRTKFLNFVLAG